MTGYSADSSCIVDEASSVGDRARLYSSVHVIGSAVGARTTVSDGTDLLRSSVANRCEIGRRNLVIDSEIDCCTYTGSNTVVTKTRIGRFYNVSWNVSLGGGNHDYRAGCMLTDLYWKKLLDIELDRALEAAPGPRLTVGSDVWIGACANVLGGGSRLAMGLSSGRAHW